MAHTHSPTRSASELPSGADGSGAFEWTLQQRDVDGRVYADDIGTEEARPSLNVTVTRSAPLMTW